MSAVLAAALLLLVRRQDAAAWQTLGSRAPVTVSYGDLVDSAKTLRNGQPLREGARTAPEGMLQPHLAPYSSLLSYAVQMIAGEDPAPHESVVDAYPSGSTQPAWVSILREGRIRVTSDGRGRARVFLPGDNPRTAWRTYYSVVRHPLGKLIPSGGGGLEVEVYAYQNDYPALELRLGPDPYRFRARRFPPRSAPLDLEGLARFFSRGGALEGAELNRETGLVLYAQPAAGQTLGGQSPTLADFAAAYRAVFHAGANQAFVSIDRHPDPLLGTVNFGGLLEDTRIGAVTLAADRRFKTIVCGLDAQTGLDVRAQVRASIPDFLTNVERGLLGWGGATAPGWTQTRFWFHPGSTGVDADPSLGLAAVTRPQFSADAERVDVDYDPEIAARQQSKLPAEVRANIRHLNDRYGKYAGRFPELRELTVVARFVAVCSWLASVRPGWLDLDGLLAVELPPVSTAREVPQLIEVEYVLPPRAGGVDAAFVARESRSVNAGLLLERSVAEVFRDAEGLEEYSRARAEVARVVRPAPDAAEKARHFENEKGRKLRELLRTQSDVRALMKALATQSIGRREEEDTARLRVLLAERGTLNAADAAGVVRLEELDREIASIMRAYHEAGAGAPQPIVGGAYTGGITMAPRLFAVKEKADSPALQRLKQARSGAGPGGGRAWIRSSAVAAPAAGAPPRKKEPAPVRTAPAHAPTGGQPAAPAGPAPAPGTPPGPTEADGGLPDFEEVAEPARPSAQRETMGARAPSGAAVTARMQPGGKIVFTRVAP